MNMQPINISKASLTDIAEMVALSYIKRRQYEKYQPQFWRYNEGAEKIQTEYFKELIADENHICLIAKDNNEVKAFVIGRLVNAPEVYNPGGLTLMIDDFCSKENDWQNNATKLLDEINQLAKNKGAAQTVIVCGALDKVKNNFLQDKNYQAASIWYVSKI